MAESCPGDKFKASPVIPPASETVKEEVIRDKIVTLLLNDKGYLLEDLELDVPFEFQTGSDIFQVKAPILVRLEGRSVLLIKCGAGSILARERAALSLARLIKGVQIPWTIVTNSEDATLLDTVTGETLDCGLGAVPAKEKLLDELKKMTFIPLPEKRAKMERQILSAFEALGLHGECH
jgi:hypothetical protein